MLVERAVIVAGGLGTRIHSETKGRIPKALLDLGGRPAIARQLSLLARHRVRKVAVIAGHLGEMLRPVLQQSAVDTGLDVQMVLEPTPRGTAGGLPLAAAVLGANPFFVLYGDMALSLDIERLGMHHLRSGATATIVVHPNDHPGTSDIVVTDEEGSVRQIWRRHAARPRWLPNSVPAGVYCCSPRVLSLIEELGHLQAIDFIADFFPLLLERGEHLHAYRTCEYLRDTGTPERLDRVRRDIDSGHLEASHRAHRRMAVFFDRDGVLTEDEGTRGVCRAEDLRLHAGAVAAVAEVNAAGALAAVVSNQPGVAKGFVTLGELALIHARLQSELGEAGAWLDGLYVCPHHGERGFPGEVAELKRDCDCRKPNPGLLERAFEELPVERDRSALIGDSWRDMLAAKRAGIWSYGVRTGRACRDSWQREAPPTLVFEDVREAASFALHFERRCQPVLDGLTRSVERPRQRGRPALLAVCGWPRAGKSQLAHALERVWLGRGLRVVRVELDHWLLPVTEAGVEAPPLEAARVAMYADIYAAAFDGADVQAPGYDPHHRKACAGPHYRFAGADVVIFDGTWSAHESVREMCDAVVFVDATGVELERRHERFCRWIGLGPRAATAHWHALWGRARPLVLPQREHASHVVGVTS